MTACRPRLVPTALLAAVLLLPISADAANDAPFRTKSQVTIPFSGAFMYDDAGEMVNVTGDVALKLLLNYHGGPLKVKAIARLQNVAATGMTSGDPYRFKGQSKMLVNWTTTVSGVDVAVAMVGDPIPGLDVKLGKNPGGALVIYHVDTDSTGNVTGSSATLQALPAPASAVTIPALQFTN